MIDRLGGGTADSRRRLAVILQSLTGGMKVGQACRELDMSSSRFHEIRREFLQRAPALLEPGVPGPVPRKTNEELERLRRENEALRERAVMAEVREELHLQTMQPAGSPGKAASTSKKNAKVRRRRKSR